MGRLGLAAAAITLASNNPLARPPLWPYEPLLRDPAVAAQAMPKIWFLGTSTLVLRDEETTIMTDGFFSRPGLLKMAFRPRTRSGRVETGLSLGGFDPRDPRADALFVAHSHHDHVLDSSAVANRTKAWLIGSSSSLYVAQGDDPPAVRPCLAEDRDQFTFGRFTVTVFETPHSEGALWAIRGEVTQKLPPRRWLGDFKASKSHAYHVKHRGLDGQIRRILIVASANYDWASFRTPRHPKGVPADVVFLTVSKLAELAPAEREEYWRRSVTSTGAKLVIPIHWDDIRLPLRRNGQLLDFKTIPYAQDDFHVAMKTILPLALRDGVEVRIPRRAGPIDIQIRTGPEPAREIEETLRLQAQLDEPVERGSAAAESVRGGELSRPARPPLLSPRLRQCTKWQGRA